MCLYHQFSKTLVVKKIVIQQNTMFKEILAVLLLINITMSYTTIRCEWRCDRNGCRQECIGDRPRPENQNRNPTHPPIRCEWRCDINGCRQECIG